MGTEEQVRSIDDGSWTAYENVDLINVDKITIGANIPTEGGIIEVHVGSPEGNLISTIEATRASGKRVGGVYGASTPMEGKVNRLGYNGPQTLYLVYKAPEDDEIAEDVLAAARKSDIAIVFVGTDENTATEEADRLTLNLPGNQVKLIQAVARENKNTIVVMQTLGCVEVEDFKNLENIPGILWTGYNGQAQGAAIPMVLFGDVTPGGKLNATWYKSVKDLPPITDYTLRAENGKPGRTLWYFTKPVSYEFGYGLSYTTFEYSDFQISKSSITPDDKITISLNVKNTGDFDGDEVVQIYMTTPDSPASLQRPIKRLKGFKRVTIPRGQTRRVEIEIDCADLWFWDLKTDRITYDTGKYVFEIGSSSQDIRGRVSASMNGKFTPQLKTVVADCRVSVLEIGETAQTVTSASLTDDSFIDVSKATVTYVSSNESVATVDATGKLTAVGPGIATITVSVLYGGKTVSDSYAVKVNADFTLASLKNGSKSILRKGRTQYSVLGKMSSQISATAKSKGLNVVVEQAPKVPGTTVVKVVEPVTGDEKRYLVNFGIKSVSDEFNNSLGRQWNVVRRNDDNMLVSDGRLEITAATGDINTASDNGQNIVLQSANSDWTIDTKLQVSALPTGVQNAGLVAYQDDSHFVKFVYTGAAMRRGGMQQGAAVPAAGSLQLYVEENGASKSTLSVNLAEAGVKDNTIWLKLEKDGSIYTAFYSVNGKNWIQAGQTEIALKDIQAGLIACNGVQNMRMGMRPGGAAAAAPAQQNSAPLKAWFDWFRIKNR